MSRGFTLLTDAQKMKVHPKEVKEIHAEAQNLIINKGVSQVAEVLEGDIFAEAQLNMVSKNTNIPKKEFKSKEEAEDFLNSL